MKVVFILLASVNINFVAFSVYLDDILIYSKTVEEHIKLLDKVFAFLNK